MFLKEEELQLQNKALLIVLLVIFIDTLGIGILIPIFPALILPGSKFSVMPEHWTINSIYILFGWLSATFPMAQFMSASIFGQLSDYFGRKKILIISMCGIAFSYLTFAIAITTKNIPLMFISRIMEGFFCGNISVIDAIIADISMPINRAKNFGLIGVAFSIGIVLGPFIGGELSDPAVISWFNPTTSFYFIAILSVINVCIISAYLPETLRVKVDKRPSIKTPFHNLNLAFSNYGIRNILPTLFLCNAGITFFFTFFSINLMNNFKFTQDNIGNFFAFMGIIMAASQGLIVPMVAKYIKDYQVLRFTIFASSVCLILFLFIPITQKYLLYYVLSFFAIFLALISAFTSSLIVRILPKNMQGEGLGISYSAIALAQIIPAILSGYAASINASLPIKIASISLILSGISFWILFKPQQYHKK